MSLEDRNRTSDNERSHLTGFRKLDIPIPDGDPKDFALSTEADFAAASQIARSFADAVRSLPYDSSLRLFEELGTQIDTAFPFMNRGGGCNTLAGQLRERTLENRDCKLPTFLLGLAQEYLNPHLSPKILVLKSNTAHPYVRIEVRGMPHFGHFLAPGPYSREQLSVFEFLRGQRATELMKFTSLGRVHVLPPNFESMRAIDQMFVED